MPTDVSILPVRPFISMNEWPDITKNLRGGVHSREATTYGSCPLQCGRLYEVTGDVQLQTYKADYVNHVNIRPGLRLNWASDFKINAALVEIPTYC